MAGNNDSSVDFISDIVAGRVNWKLRVRVINLTHVANPHKLDETINIEMILLDEKANKIQANVKRPWISRFISCIREGSTYLIEKFLVAQNDVTFKKTNHKFKVNFMGSTAVTNIAAPEIPLNFFDFCDFPTILKEERKDLFIDIIGHVVEKDNIREKQLNGKITYLLDLVLEDLAQHRLKCTLWGDHAKRMQTELENLTSSTVVVIVMQLCRLTRYMGTNGVSSAFTGTKLFINTEIPEIVDYKSRVDFGDAMLSTGVTQMTPVNTLSVEDELLQAQKMTISELIEAQQNCVGALLVKVIEIDLEHGWAFNSCNTCFRSASKCETKFYCPHCKTLVTATPRYKLHLQVIDDTGSTTFLLFNQLVTAYVGRSAVEVLRTCKRSSTTTETPDEFRSLLDKEFLFKVEVSDANTIRGFQTYVVRKITADQGIIRKFIQKHGLYTSNVEADTDYAIAVTKLIEDNPVINLDDDSPTKTISLDLDETPPTNKHGKRPMTDLEGINLNAMEFSPESANKLCKSVVKIEPKE